ncbi:hypothetical protein DAI22_01g491850 [Oryza sativa Japonica Group]|nr:hypothetical protein DAI22_01g491850 [Oryza sativa Japonica Group]
MALSRFFFHWFGWDYVKHMCCCLLVLLTVKYYCRLLYCILYCSMIGGSLVNILCTCRLLS